MTEKNFMREKITEPHLVCNAGAKIKSNETVTLPRLTRAGRFDSFRQLRL